MSWQLVAPSRMALPSPGECPCTSLYPSRPTGRLGMQTKPTAVHHEPLRARYCPSQYSWRRRLCVLPDTEFVLLSPVLLVPRSEYRSDECRPEDQLSPRGNPGLLACLSRSVRGLWGAPDNR
jgi:hypothetical protein